MQGARKWGKRCGPPTLAAQGTLTGSTGGSYCASIALPSEALDRIERWQVMLSGSPAKLGLSSKWTRRPYFRRDVTAPPNRALSSGHRVARYSISQSRRPYSEPPNSS